MIIKQRKSTKARLVFTGVAAFALILVSGCATTTKTKTTDVANITDQQRAVLGKIRVTSTANKPILGLSEHPTTKGEALAGRLGNAFGGCAVNPHTYIFFPFSLPFCAFIMAPIIVAAETAAQKTLVFISSYSLGASQSINSPSALVEDKVRAYPTADVPRTVILGTYVSDIKGGWAGILGGNRKLKITFKQSGKDIIGTDVNQKKIVTGTRKEDTIKFKYDGRGSYLTGKWKINSDGTKLEGTWNTSRENGKWNLTKT